MRSEKGRKRREKLASRRYVGWLGHTNARTKGLGWSKQDLVDRATALARETLLLPDVPPLTPRAVGFMGLKKCDGLRVEKPPPRAPRKPTGRAKAPRKRRG